MKLLVDGSGRFLSMAASDPGWVVPPGGAVHDSARTFADLPALDAAVAALGVPGEIGYDPATDTMAARARTLSAEEQGFRADAQTLKTYRTTPKASITAGQTVEAIWALTDMMRRVFRELAD